MSEHRDPAVEAAKRALNTDHLRSDPIDAFTLAGAREALAPIRARIQALDAAQETFRGDSLDYHDLAQSAIEDIRDLCFTSEELSNE